MANRFTQKAESALKRAQSEASELGHTYIGSEHLLLGLIGESESIASKMLVSRGADAETLRLSVVTLSGSGSKSSVSSSDMTPKTRRIIEEAAAKALSTGSAYIGTEHILFALLSEKDCVAMKLLLESGVALTEIKGDLGVYFDLDSGRERGAQKKGDEKKISGAPTLSNYGRDLTRLAREGKIDPIIGRDVETERIVRILSRRTKNNPCLVGEPGVGKTAVVEGLAQRIADGDVPETLAGKRIITLDVPSMIAGAKYRGEFEERMKSVMSEVAKCTDIILFVDEIHMIIGAGAAEGAVDAANIIKPALARGEMQMIGATTLDEYRTHIEKDAALERRFQSVSVGEPSESETIKIIMGLREKYEAHHGLRISGAAIDAAVKLSVRYIPDRFLPDKAIDLIDEAAAKLRISSYTAPAELKEIDERLHQLKQEKESAILCEDFLLAAELREKEKALVEEKRCADEEWRCQSDGRELVLEKEDIADVVTAATGIPVSRLIESERERLVRLEDEIGERLIGQSAAISAVASAIRRGRVGLKDPCRPIGSFIFLGRTGVGKTELARILADVLFGSESAMIRLDMSEYMEKHSVSKLIGSPPGYVGYGEGGQLTERVRRRPYSVVLFDEIEKAHPDVYNLLLQILEDGFLTDSQGRRVDFRNTVIIMTSNIGAVDAERAHTLGFSDSPRRADHTEKMLSALKSEFRPEFLNRVDEIIVFNTLGRGDIRKIADIMIEGVRERAEKIGLVLRFDESVSGFVTEKSFNESFGARPLRRTITEEIENLISESLLRGQISTGKEIFIFAKDGKIELS